MWGAIIGLFGISVAIGLPLWIERRKRPSFTIREAPCAVTDDGLKYLNVAVINEPITSLSGRWLLRNTATGCVASLNFEEAPIPSGKYLWGVNARWAAKPEPWNEYLDAHGNEHRRFTLSKLEQCFRMDVEPSPDGEVIAVATKVADDRAAYAHSRDSFRLGERDMLRAPKLKLAGEKYKLTVVVRAGGVKHSQDFWVLNPDETHDGFRLEPMPPSEQIT